MTTGTCSPEGGLVELDSIKACPLWSLDRSGRSGLSPNRVRVDMEFGVATHETRFVVLALHHQLDQVWTDLRSNEIDCIREADFARNQSNYIERQRWNHQFPI